METYEKHHIPVLLTKFEYRWTSASINRWYVGTVLAFSDSHILFAR